MKDTKFFEQALELVAPWKVVDVNMDLAAKKVEVKVDCGSAEMWLDPQSGQRLHIHGYEQRRWPSFDNYRTRILFFCGKLTFFQA